MTDILTDHAIKWHEETKPKDKALPALPRLSKPKHYPFTPAPRHEGRYKNKPIPYPETIWQERRKSSTLNPTGSKQARHGIHGTDHMETLAHWTKIQFHLLITYIGIFVKLFMA